MGRPKKSVKQALDEIEDIFPCSPKDPLLQVGDVRRTH